MRAKTAPGGRLTRETERLVKEPGLCSTRRRRVRSGWTQAGISEAPPFCVEESFVAVLPLVWGGAVVVVGGVAGTADGDMVGTVE